MEPRRVLLDCPRPKMGAMATWEDGPEYAPLERPADFSVPPAPALEDARAGDHPAASAPLERPAFDLPAAPVAPLHQLVPPIADERDPVQPFAVATSALTSTSSAWEAAHWSPPSGPPASGSAPLAAVPASFPAGPALAAYPPPATQIPPAASPSTPWAPVPDRSWPGEPPPPPSALGQHPYPAHGTPQWFGPGPPPVQQSPALVEHDTRAVLEAASPGLCICLGLGGLLYPFAPLLLGVAFFLRTRVKVAQVQVRQAFLVAGLFLGLMALIGFLLNSTSPGDWWTFFGASSLVTCWALLASVLVLVHRALKRRAGAAPRRYPTEWR